MNIRLASETLTTDSIVDGPGLRTVIWTQGCPHNCKGCHNPGTHDFEGGVLRDIEDVKKEISGLEMQQGITLSGGDPFMQPEACLELAKHAHSLGMDVWAFSGFSYENLIKDDKKKELLKEVDVLIDGPFILNQKSYDLKFKGSKNQRIIKLKDGEFEKIIG